MSPGKVLAFFCSCLLLLGALAWFFPQDGLDISTVHLEFPTLHEVLAGEDEKVEEEKVSPDEQLQRMSELFRQHTLAALADSLHYFQHFFDSSEVRIIFPDNNPAIWDSMFSTLDRIHARRGQARVIHYGDSQIEQDRITASVRTFFESHFGGRGVGVIPPVQMVQTLYYFQTSEGDWQRYAVYGPASLRVEHKRYGPMGSMAVVTDSATVRIDPKRNKRPEHEFTRIRVLYGQNSSDFSVSLNVGESYSSQSAPDSMLAWSEFNWQLSTPVDHFVLKFTGSAEVYGILLDGNNGVSVDNVPMRGSTGFVFTTMDHSLLRRSYRQLNVKMILMEYGGNGMPYMKTEKAVNDYVDGIDWQLKYIHSVMPDLPILFLGPADMAATFDGEVTTYPMLEPLIERLKQVCLDNGVAYWDMYRVMGGRNSIVEWASTDPPYAAPDYVHFTIKGSRRIGALLESTLSTCYDYYKFRRAHLDDSTMVQLSQVQGTTESYAAALDSMFLEGGEALDSLLQSSDQAALKAFMERVDVDDAVQQDE